MATGVDDRLATEKASLSLNRGASAVFSSAGARAAESDAAISLSLFGMAIDGDDVGGAAHATLRPWFMPLPAGPAQCLDPAPRHHAGHVTVMPWQHG